MSERSKNSYNTLLHDFVRFDMPVICPGCAGKAVVKPGNFTFENFDFSEVRAVCISCGFSKKIEDKPEPVLYTTKNRIVTGRAVSIGDATDPFFGYPLWLSASFGEHTLWAYNPEHLAFLRTHISAMLRERNPDKKLNRSLGSRLPKWMSAAGNRDALLKKISELESK
ncbi:MAG: hypothetical protein LAT84_07470 [Balneolia bacterium]|nr:hypothetical protein [Balneolia bacterium]